MPNRQGASAPRRGAAPELEQILETGDVPRLLTFTDLSSGLRAYLVIDDLTLGPAVGGTRTLPYLSAGAAVAEAAALARTMTLKCSIAGLDAGGAKMVVDARPNLRRSEAFRVLGRRIEELGGLFLTAGDLGTRHDDLAAMAAETSFVRTDDAELAAAVASGVRRCVAVCAELRGRDGLEGLRVAVQGCGAIGGAVARDLAAAGASLLVADIDEQAARATADAVGGRTVATDEILLADVDVVAPCAVGGVLDAATADSLRAWAVCGAANNILVGVEVGARLAARGVLHVPDLIASAGGVIAGVCAARGDGRAAELIAALGDTARAVLEEAQRRGLPVQAVAEDRARRRIRDAGASS